MSNNIALIIKDSKIVRGVWSEQNITSLLVGMRPADAKTIIIALTRLISSLTIL